MNRAISRTINAKHRFLLIGKASTLSAQIKQLADMTAGRVPQWQDVFASENDIPRNDYNPNISKDAMK